MLRIAFVLPNLEIGGGVSVSLAHARHALEAGHSVSVVVADNPDSGSSSAAIEGLPVLNLAQATRLEYDIAIATWWQDLLLLWRLAAGRHALFLQRMEDRIYRPGEPSHVLVQKAFRIPLPGITIAYWLHDQFRVEYGRNLAVVHNGIDKSVFRPDGPTLLPQLRRGLRVLVEGPLGVKYKNVVEALRLSRSIADETWLLTSTRVGPIAGVDRVFSRLSPVAAAAVYRSCDVLVKLSTVEGLPLPPLEMFHCGGTTLAFDVPGVTEYAVHGRNALLTPQGDYGGAAEQLASLHDEPEQLEHLKAGALETARAWPSERKAGEGFIRAVEALIEDEPPTDSEALGELELLSKSLDPKLLAFPPNRFRDVSVIRSIRHSIEVRMPGMSGRR